MHTSPSIIQNALSCKPFRPSTRILLLIPIILGAILVALLSAFLSMPVQAAPTATINLDVDTPLDSNEVAYQACTTGPADCSLRGAINMANADSGNHYILSLPADTYQLTISPDGTPDDNADGDLDIAGNLTIQGAGEGVTFIQAGTDMANGIDRVLHLIDSNAALTLTQLTVSLGKVYGYGGGIYNAGDLSLENVTTISNTVIAQDPVGVEGRGGGIYNDGHLRVLDSTIRDNRNTIEGMMIVHAGEVAGAGIYNGGGTLEITNTLIISNYNSHSGGGIFNWGGTLNITSSQVVSNSARGTAGIYIYAGNAEIHSTSVSRNVCTDFHSCGIQNNGTLTLTNSTISANQGDGSGGGIYNTGVATITHSSIMSNTTPLGYSGGGIYNSAGTLFIANSSVYTNTATYGGGVYNTSGGQVTLVSCAVYDNRSPNSYGGGIVNNSGTMEITNTTITENVAGGGGGGGIVNGGVLNLSNATLSGNTATGSGGGIWSPFTTLNISNSIITNSTGGDCSGSFNGNYNLIDDPTCGSATIIGSVTNFDPVLRDNGGGTPTHALLSGSNAIDMLADGISGCIANTSVDQRGAVRAGGDDRGGDSCDIGAYEYASGEQPNAITLQEFSNRSGTFQTWFILAGLSMSILIIWSLRRLQNIKSRNL